MNPRAWCAIDCGPCQLECTRTCRKLDRLAANMPVVGQPKSDDGSEFGSESRLPAGISLGVLFIGSALAMAFTIGVICGLAWR